ncbi:unnamed protein product [Paramecium primaurelia]|uniref:MCM C-terminal AAA(+) ATPase domain-containing protein n=1 Tax=Paramecium primaurelia TaxID=5886 RepID=A0A8S1LTZ9_PARPR|nr:unnamed protein product [Paramecium primaurelia]
MNPQDAPQQDLFYRDFLERFLSNIDIAQIEAMRQQNKIRFPINLDLLRQESRQQYPNLVDDLIRNPTDFIRVFQQKLSQICKQLQDQQEDDDKKGVQTDKTYKIYFEGKLGKNYVTPRGLGAAQINQLVCTQAIVTKMSLVLLKLQKSVHFIEKKNQFKQVEYFNNMDPSARTSSRQVRVVQKKDEEGNPMIFEFGLSDLNDMQTLVVQELPERTPTGMLPRSLEVILDQDLVDRVKPGDRVEITGVYKCIQNSSTKANGTFRTTLIAQNIKVMNAVQETKISEVDIRHIKEISKKPNLLEYMSKSIAPSIFGHGIVKQSILLQLLGGTEKNLETGTHLRGDINILLIGDPSTAKSQLLRYVMGTAPLVVTTTGRGTSSVGLTAAVKRDNETGENSLEAGAMVLADGGVILIDEFDKMNEIDRVAIHEVMEQQTVTIAKAGIHCSLNARCSVLAAANPLYGEYQLDMAPTKNIGLPDSLLSRFDLLFIILDEKKKDIDRKVAERVTKNHRYKGQYDEEENIGDIIQPMAQMSIKQEISPFVQQSAVYHSNDQKDLLTQSFLKKYIMYAKENYANVILDDEAAEEVTRQWTKMRQNDLLEKQIRTQPITIRSLESLIRLASAHAKLRLSNIVTKADVKIGAKLMKISLQMDQEEEVEENKKPSGRKSSLQKLKSEQPLSAGRQKIESEQPKQEEQENQLIVKSDKKKQKQDDPKDKEAEFHLYLQQAHSQNITRDQLKAVHKVLRDFKEKLHQDVVDIDIIWGELQSQSRIIIADYLQFLKCLLELDKQEKVQFDDKKRTVQLL